MPRFDGWLCEFPRCQLNHRHRQCQVDFRGILAAPAARHLCRTSVRLSDDVAPDGAFAVSEWATYKDDSPTGFVAFAAFSNKIFKPPALVNTDGRENFRNGSTWLSANGRPPRHSRDRDGPSGRPPKPHADAGEVPSGRLPRPSARAIPRYPEPNTKDPTGRE